MQLFLLILWMTSCTLGLIAWVPGLTGRWPWPPFREITMTYGRESGDWGDGDPQAEIEPGPGDHGTCAVCSEEIILTPVRSMKLKWLHMNAVKDGEIWVSLDAERNDHEAQLGGPA